MTRKPRGSNQDWIHSKISSSNLGIFALQIAPITDFDNYIGNNWNPCNLVPPDSSNRCDGGGVALVNRLRIKKPLNSKGGIGKRQSLRCLLLVFLFVWFVLFVVNWFWLWFQMSANVVYSPLALG